MKVILASTTIPATDFAMAHRVILTESLSSTPERREYVTHLQTFPDEGRHHGHYFPNDLSGAMKDFAERAEKIGAKI